LRSPEVAGGGLIGLRLADPENARACQRRESAELPRVCRSAGLRRIERIAAGGT
jgi:hypothetical protein